MKPLRLRLLGRPEVSRGEQTLEFRSRKEFALLVYLATEGGLHTREKLADLFWPNSGEERGRAALRNALSGLRKTLRESTGEEYLHAGRDSAVGLEPASEVELDLSLLSVDPARSLVEVPGGDLRGTLEELRVIAATYRGEFLQDFYLDEAPEFEYWVGLEREGWRQRIEAVFDRLSGLELRAGEASEAVATAEHWTLHAPTSEAAYLRLIEAHFAAGNEAAALRTFEACQRMLEEGLRVGPSPETAALAARIRAEATPRSTPRHERSQGALDVPFVGRSEEFRVLVAEYLSAREGGARAVAVAGEAGIGKTRLAREFLRWATAEGADVLRGAAFEATGGLPYGPLVDALRERVERERAPDDLLEDVWLTELSRLLPELNERYPDLPPPVSNEASARARLFEAVAEFVAALASSKPVVLFADDLQWADAATLDLLRYASRRWAEEGAPVLLVMAAREETPEARVRLTRSRAGFSHDLPMRRVTLGPLSGNDTSQLVRSLVDTESEEEEGIARLQRLVGWLHEETGGQPFFLTETLSALLERGVLIPGQEYDGRWTVDVEGIPDDMVPPGVREAVLARLGRLGPDASMLLAAASVLGRPSGFENLRRVTELEEEASLSALEEALASGLLREIATEAAPAYGDTPEAYACAHDKIRDVIYTEAGGARRRVYHRRALRTLEEVNAPSAELARHALAAGLSDEAFRHLLAAGDEAMSLFASSDAIEHYEEAETVLAGARGRDEPPPEAEIERLYANLGRVYELSGEREKARATYEAMLASSREDRQPSLQCAALNRLAILSVQRFGDAKAAMGFLEEALEVADASGERVAVAETEWNLAQMAIYVWELDAALDHAEKALGIARELRLEELVARSLDAIGLSHYFAGRFDECARYVREAAALYAQRGDKGAGSVATQYLRVGSPPSGELHNRAMEAQCLATLSVAEVNRGELAAGMSAGRAAMKISREINNEWSQVLAAANLSQALVEGGQHGEALRLTREGVWLARKLPDPILPLISLFSLGNAYQAVLGLQEAQAAYLEALEIAEAVPRPWRLMFTKLCANRALAGNWEAAYRYALKAVEVRDASPSRLMLMDFVRYHETEALLRGGDEDLAREDAKRLGERVGENRRFRFVHLRMLAVLARWEGDEEEELECLREAETLAGEIGLPGEQWQICAALGDLHERRGEPDEARGTFSWAARILETLAGEIEDEALKEGFLSAAQPRRVLGFR